MNPFVLLFFAHNVFATLVLGIKFNNRKDGVFKNYGSALILNAIAFAIWSAAIIAQPQNLAVWVEFGAVFFIASFIMFFAAGIQNVSDSNRRSLIFTGSIVAIVVFLLRIFVYPSAPAFSPEGLFFFNTNAVMQVIYIFALALTALPATEALASKFGHRGYSALVRYGFIAEIMGGIVLITSVNITALYIVGYIMGLVYLALWTSLLFSKAAWAEVR